MPGTAAASAGAGVRPRHQVALRHESVVGLDDGEHAHLVRLREVTDRRDLRTGAQAAVDDQAAQAVHDLGDERRGGVGLESEHRSSCKT